MVDRLRQWVDGAQCGQLVRERVVAEVGADQRDAHAHDAVDGQEPVRDGERGECNHGRCRERQKLCLRTVGEDGSGVHAGPSKAPHDLPCIWVIAARSEEHRSGGRERGTTDGRQWGDRSGGLVAGALV